MSKKLAFSIICLAGMALCCTIGGFPIQKADAAAKAYPNQTIQMIVPSSAGGSTDLLARILAKYAGDALGQSVVVVNVTGANGAIGGRQVLDAAPDGHTIMFHHTTLIPNNLSGLADFSYDAFAMGPNFASDNSLSIYTKGDGAYKTLSSLIEGAKKNPGKLKLAASTGGFTQLFANAFKKAAGIDIAHVDLGDNQENTAALLGGHIDAMTNLYGTNKAYIEGGQFVCLGMPTEKRIPVCPDVPTFKEQGLDFVFPGYQFGIFYPKNTPADIMAVFNDALKKATENKKAQADILKIGAAPDYRDVPENTKFWNTMNETIKGVWVK